MAQKKKAIAATSRKREWRARALGRIERALAIPTAILSILLIVVVLVPLACESLPGTWANTLWMAERIIRGAFTKYVSSVAIAPDRTDYIRTHPIELLLIVVPIMRYARWLEILRATRVLDAAYVFVATFRAIQASKYRLAISVPLYATISFPVLVLACAVVALRAEREVPGATITTLARTYWWGAMVATGGDTGELHALTALGRTVQMVLMLTGAALYGTLIIGAVCAYVTRRLSGGTRKRTKRRRRHRGGTSGGDDGPPIDDNC